MILTGIQKLRLVVSFLFICYAVITVLFYVASFEESNTIDDWWYSMSETEQEAFIELEDEYFSKLPEYNTYGYYEIMGVLDWILGGGLFILMAKLFSVNTISNKSGSNVDLVSLKRDIVGTETWNGECDSCGTKFEFKKNVNEPTYVICPNCGKKEVI